MAIVTSKHTSPLGLPRGPVIQPGNSVRIENWRVLRNHAVIQAWLAAGVISVEDEGDETPPIPRAESPAGGQDGALADLRNEYQELFGKRPFMGWDAETLRQKIDAKLSE